MKNENNNNEKVETGKWKVQKDQNGVHRKWGTPLSSLQCQCKVSMIIQAIFYPPPHSKTTANMWKSASLAPV